MKAGTSKREKWNVDRGIRILKKRVRRKEHIKNLKKHGLFYHRRDDSPAKTKNSSNKIIDDKIFYAPHIFSVETNRGETLKFFEDIFNYLNEHKGFYVNVFIDSTEVQVASESTLMYMFAILKDVICDGYNFRGNYPKMRKARDIYKKCGFEAVLKNFKGTAYITDYQMLHRGDTADPDVAGEVCRFICSDSCVESSLLYPALIEMMSNTIQHAYDSNSRLEKKWQLYAYKNVFETGIIFLDTGSGIQETVKRNQFEKIRQKFTMFSGSIESKILESAFKGDFRSNTEQANRGKGLPQIYELLTSENSKVSYAYSGKTILKTKGKEVTYFDDSNIFCGTLYEISFRKRGSE